MALAETQKYEIPEIGSHLEAYSSQNKPESCITPDVSAKIREIAGTAGAKQKVIRGAVFSVEFDGESAFDKDN
jgi:hypothetical protein